MNILVTGAASYIGSIVAQELIQEGNTVVALDNLEQGHREAVTREALFVHADLRDSEKLGWEPEQRSVEVIIESAGKWQKEHPHGYGSKRNRVTADQR